MSRFMRCLALSTLAVCGTMSHGQTVFTETQSTERPQYMPRLSDVSMRSLTLRPETVPTAHAFHVTRLDWVYPGTNTAGIQEVKDAGLFLQPTLNSVLNDSVTDASRNRGRMLDVHGNMITGPWMHWNQPWWGSANRPEYAEVWLTWARYYFDLGLEVFHMDDPALNISAMRWQPNSNIGTNNTGPGCFSSESMMQFHDYLQEQGLNSWREQYPVNHLANTTMAGRACTAIMVTRSNAGGFGVGGNGVNGSGGVPRLYFQRGAFSYNTLQTLPIASVADRVEITTYTHDGDHTIRTFSNGAQVGVATQSAVVGAFGGGGHLSIPLQSGSTNQPGDMATLLIYGRMLSNVERQGIEAWLGQRYDVAVQADASAPDAGDPGRYLLQWLDADTLLDTLDDQDPVALWPARKGVAAQATATTLPGKATSTAPTLVANAINGHPAVRFDGVGDWLSFPWFSLRHYVLDHVADQNLLLAPDAVRLPFEDFQRQSVRDFFRYVMAELDAYAGKHIPISSNNGRGWVTPYDMFDFGIAEVNEFNVKPSYLYGRIREARNMHAKAQVFTMPVPGNQHMTITNWDNDYPTLRDVTRKGLAFCYSAGGHMQVPWDHYMGGTYPRYFGDPDDYAHIFKFVRDNADLIDGYDDAFVTGYDLTDNRFRDHHPIRLTGGSGQVTATLRVVASDVSAPAVIHLVEWNHTQPRAFAVVLNHSVFYGDDPPQIEMRTHERGTTENFSVVTQGDSTTAYLPVIDTWAMLVVTPPAGSGLSLR